MKRGISLAVVLIVVLFSLYGGLFFNTAHHASAATVTYEVNYNGGSCSDVNGSPYYCTIQGALDAVPGVLSDAYVINIYPGSYSEAVTVAGKTTSVTNTITIQSKYSSNKAIITGNGVINSVGIEVQGVDYVTLNALEVSYFPHALIRYAYGATNGVIKNSVVRHTSTSFSPPTQICIWLGTSLTNEGASAITIQNNLIEDCADQAINVDVDSTNITVSGNTITNIAASSSAVTVSAGGSTGPISLLGNTISDTGRGATLTGSVSGNLISENTIYTITNSGITLSGPGTTTVSGNTIYGSSNGIELQASGNIISDNTLYSNTNGINDNGGSTQISNNTIRNNSSAGILINSGVTGNTIDHNVIVKNNYGIQEFSGSGTAHTIESNTFADQTTDGLIFADPHGTTVTIKNNIFANNGRFGILAYSGSETPTEYNTFYNNPNANYAVSGSGSYTTAEEINAASSQFTGNTVGEVTFVDASGNDYHVRWGATSIDAGDPGDSYTNEPSPNGGRINNGAYGNTSEARTTFTTSSGDDDVAVSATVEPRLTMSLGSNTCTLGTLTTGSVSGCSMTLTVGTNATNGMAIYMDDVPNTGFTTGTDTIAMTTGTLSAGTVGAGWSIAAPGTALAYNGGSCPGNNTVTDIGTSTFAMVPTTGGPLADISVPLCFAAAVAATTPAGTYTHVMEVTAVATF